MRGSKHSVYLLCHLDQKFNVSYLDLVVDGLNGDNVELGLGPSILERIATALRCSNGMVFCPTFLTWISSFKALRICVEVALKAPVVLSEDNTCFSRCMGAMSGEDFPWVQASCFLGYASPTAEIPLKQTYLRYSWPIFFSLFKHFDILLLQIFLIC